MKTVSAEEIIRDGVVIFNHFKNQYYYFILEWAGTRRELEIPDTFITGMQKWSVRMPARIFADFINKRIVDGPWHTI